MRVIKAPLRVSLFGGGTDRPSYYEKYGSTIISFAITRYIYLIWNERPTGGCRLSYSEVEELDSLRDAKHTLVKATAERYGIPEPCTLTIVGDVPKGTGLGSSGTLALCLCWLVRGAAVYSDLLQTVSHAAFVLEQSVSPDVGFQDSLPAYYGDFRCYQAGEYGERVGNFVLPDEATSIVSTFGLLLYTGIARESSQILPNWDKTNVLHQISALAQSQVSLSEYWTPKTLGDALHTTWLLKQKIPGVCTLEMNDQYERARKAGALGGKLCGAGGGGCWFFLVPPPKRQSVIDTLGLIEIPFKVATEGVREKWL